MDCNHVKGLIEADKAEMHQQKDIKNVMLERWDRNERGRLLNKIQHFKTTDLEICPTHMLCSDGVCRQLTILRKKMYLPERLAL